MILATICNFSHSCESQIWFLGLVTLQGSALREREVIQEEEEEQFAIAATGELKAELADMSTTSQEPCDAICIDFQVRPCCKGMF